MTTATSNAGAAIADGVQAPSPAPVDLMRRPGLNLQTMDDYWRFAEWAVKSGFAPKGMNQAGAALAIQFGKELGFEPAQAISTVIPINGRPTLEAKTMLGLCMRSGRFDFEVFEESFTGTPYEDDFTASCTIGRVGVENHKTLTFSVADAKRAKLWDRRGKDGFEMPWVTYPKRMLRARALSFALRDMFPDVLTGLYSREEMVVDQVLDQLDLTGAAPREPFDASKVRRQPEAPSETGTAPGWDSLPCAEELQTGPVESQAAPPEPEPTPPPLKGCPECGGVRSGRGFKHNMGCPKLRAAAQPLAEPSQNTKDDAQAIGMARQVLVREFDQLEAPDQAQFLHQWGLASRKLWPNIQACFDPGQTGEALEKKLDQVRARLAQVAK